MKTASAFFVWIVAAMAVHAVGVSEFETMLEKGNAYDCVSHAKLFYYGSETEQDFTKAAKLFYKAATEGNAEGQYWLAKMYSEGSGVKQRSDKAYVWAFAASRQGYPDAQNLLGVFYSNGQGVASNGILAAECFTKAAEQGNAKAQFNLGSCYEYGTGVEKNLEKAVKWYRKSAEQGFVPAQAALGACYQYGIGVPVNFNISAGWYAKAAEQGNVPAQLVLGMLFELGKGVDPDDVAAAGWYRRAAEAGNTEGQVRLGVCYEIGKGVPQNMTSALHWYRQSATGGNAHAQLLMGTCLEKGRGAPIDLASARSWYDKAAANGMDEARQRLLFLNRDEATAEAVAAEKKKSMLVFRGLYLGMPIQDAAITLEKRLAEAKQDVTLYVTGEAKSLRVVQGVEIEINADESGNVISFYLANSFADVLFDTHDAPLSVFIKMFLQAYGVTDVNEKVERVPVLFEGRQIGTQQQRIFRHPSGYELVFYDSYAVKSSESTEDALGSGLCKPIGSFLIRKIDGAQASEAKSN